MTMQSRKELELDLRMVALDKFALAVIPVILAQNPDRIYKWVVREAYTFARDALDVRDDERSNT